MTKNWSLVILKQREKRRSARRKWQVLLIFSAVLTAEIPSSECEDALLDLMFGLLCPSEDNCLFSSSGFRKGVALLSFRQVGDELYILNTSLFHASVSILSISTQSLWVS